MFAWLRKLFRRRPPARRDYSSEQFYYDAAYKIFPEIALKRPHEFFEWQTKMPRPEIFFGLLAGTLLQCPEEMLGLTGFVWHSGKLSDDRDYVAVQYPTPAPIEMSQEEVLAMGPGEFRKQTGPLCPFFSLWAGSAERADVPRDCYVLGQSPNRDWTTLRRVTLAAHYNLGPGVEPSIAALLEAVENEAERAVIGGTTFRPDLRGEVDDEMLMRMDDGSGVKHFTIGGRPRVPGGDELQPFISLPGSARVPE